MKFDPVAFFKSLTEKNRLAQSYGFQFGVVSDLEGFSEVLESMQLYVPLVCVSDTATGTIGIDNAPFTREVRTVFMFMPHPIQSDWVAARAGCFAVMRELTRQFLSVLIRQDTRLRQGGISIDPSVSFQEIDRYFFSGGACAFFSVAFESITSLVLNPDQWTQDPTMQ